MADDKKIKRIPEKTLEELKAKHGDDVFVLTSPESEGDLQVQVAFKRPTRGIYRKYKAESVDEKKKTIAIENLAMACLIHPTPEEFDALLDRMPALADSFGLSLMDKVGGAGVADVKKI